MSVLVERLGECDVSVEDQRKNARRAKRALVNPVPASVIETFDFTSANLQWLYRLADKYDLGTLGTCCYYAGMHIDVDYEQVMFMSVVLAGCHDLLWLDDRDGEQLIDTMNLYPGVVFSLDPLAVHAASQLASRNDVLALAQLEVPRQQWEAVRADVLAEIGRD